jgi:cell division septum initiation protein DivIVA
MKKILDMGWCIALMLLYSCSCNQEPTVTLPENDSLQIAVKFLEMQVAEKSDSIDILRTELYNAKVDVLEAKKQGSKTADNIREAITKHDTVKIIQYATDCEQDFRTYVAAVEQEDSLQSAMIVQQDSVIDLQKATIELKSNHLANMSFRLIRAKNENDSLLKRSDKLEKKLARSKWWLRHTAPVAVVGATALIVPQYTPLAVVGGVVLYMLTKPKRK